MNMVKCPDCYELMDYKGTAKVVGNCPHIWYCEQCGTFSSTHQGPITEFRCGGCFSERTVYSNNGSMIVEPCSCYKDYNSKELKDKCDKFKINDMNQDILDQIDQIMNGGEL